MNSFSVVKILGDRGVNVPEAIVYGDVEIRPASSDLENEKAALNESIESHSSAIQAELNCRICCVVAAESTAEATRLADQKFEAVLDLKSNQFPISRLALSECGFVKNLSDGVISPMLQGFDYGNMFVRRQFLVQMFDDDHLLLARSGELVERYKRSLHWTRNAKNEKNQQLKILFYWFSVEALLKEDENDQIGNWIRLFLGFPNSTAAQYVSISTISRLERHSEYLKWKRKLPILMDEIREFRNSSVHFGFRSIDAPAETLKLYEKITTLGAYRCQGAVKHGIFNNLKTISEFKDLSGIIFEQTCDVEKDIHGNIIFSLQNINEF